VLIHARIRSRGLVFCAAIGRSGNGNGDRRDGADESSAGLAKKGCIYVPNDMKSNIARKHRQKSRGDA